MRLAEIISVQIPFSTQTFGTGMRTKGICKHIRAKLREIETAPHDISEWVDVILLAIDGAWRTGHNAEEVAQAVIDKLHINMKRKWNMPSGDDEMVSHIEEQP